MGNLRYAVRVLLKNPLVTAAAILSLALGIGANVALFSVFNGIVFKPLPARDPHRVVSVYTTYPDGARYGNTSWPDYLDYRSRSRTLEGLVAWNAERVHVVAGDRTLPMLGTMVSANYFSVLGIDAAPGRAFRPGEDDLPVAVIGYSLWQSEFHGDPAIVGRPVRINDQPYTIVGVAPRGFWGLGPEGSGIWFPPASRISTLQQCRECNTLQMTARLRPGVTIPQAEAELRLLARDVEQGSHRGATITLAPGSVVTPRDSAQIATLFSLIFAALGVILLIACTNVAGLLLARAAASRREMGVRAALGARRFQLVRQVLAESLLLSSAAGAAGLFLSLWAVDLIHAIQPPGDTPFAPSVAPDLRVFLFAGILSLVTGLVLGFFPAIRGSSPDIMQALKGNAPGSGSTRLKTIFIAAQISLTMILLVSAGLLLRGFHRAATLDPGFVSDRILSVELDLRLSGYDLDRAANFYSDLETSLASAPGVRSVSLAHTVPLGGRLTSIGITRDASENFRMAGFNVVSPAYFRTLGLPLVSGREFDSRDRRSAPAVALVNETMARSFFPGEDPIGKNIFIGAAPIQVVGIVKDSRYVRVGETPRPHFYRLLAQDPQDAMTLLVATTSTPSAALPIAREAIRRLDSRLPILNAQSLSDQVRRSLWDSRQGATLAGIFGIVALLLAAVGLYGVVSYTVAGRTREIGVRVALGATSQDVVRMILSEGLRRVALGFIAGTLGSAAAGVLLRKFLYGVSPADPFAWLAVSLLLTVTAVAASWWPARRASRVDPMSALRQE